MGQWLGHLSLVLMGTYVSELVLGLETLRAEGPPDQERLSVPLLWALTDFGF